MNHRSFWLGTSLALCVAAAHADAPAQPAAVPEFRSGLLTGYLSPESLPDSRALLPAPPEQNSADMARDQAISRATLALRDTPRWALATADNDLRFPQAAETFSCALNAPVSSEDTPYLYQLLRRSLTDAGLATYAAKNFYVRTRPLMVNQAPVCAPDAEPLKKDGSYPSGHSAVGWAWALILSELAPEHTNALLARGFAYGQSRVVCNVHWQSDVDAGRLIGAAAVARLHADPVFLADLDIARRELAAVRAKGLKPPRDCQAETQSLATRP